MLSVPEHSVLKSKLCVKDQRYITARDNQIEATNDYTWPRCQLYHHSKTKRNYCPPDPLALALSCSALLTVCLLLVAFLFCLHKHIQRYPVFYAYLLAKKQQKPIKYENIFHFPPVAFLICNIYSKWDANGIISISSAHYWLYLSFGHHLSNLLTIIRP